MDRIKVAKELVRIAKSLVALDESGKTYSTRNVNDVTIAFKEFRLAVAGERTEKEEAKKILEDTINKVSNAIGKYNLDMGDDVEIDLGCWYSGDRHQFEDYIRFVYSSGKSDLISKAITTTKRILKEDGFAFKRYSD